MTNNPAVPQTSQFQNDPSQLHCIKSHQPSYYLLPVPMNTSIIYFIAKIGNFSHSRQFCQILSILLSKCFLYFSHATLKTFLLVIREKILIWFIYVWSYLLTCSYFPITTINLSLKQLSKAILKTKSNQIVSVPKMLQWLPIAFRMKF